MRSHLTPGAALAALPFVAAAAGAQVAPARPTGALPVPARAAVTAAAPPASVTARAHGPGVVRLTWAAAAGSGGYTVSRATSAAGPWTVVNAAPVTTTELEDRGVAPNGAYFYRVAARYGGAEVASAAVPVATPCDGYCSTATCAPKPATLLTVRHGSSGTGASLRLTLDVTAVDAQSGAALPGTITVGTRTGQIGRHFEFPPCRTGGPYGEIVPCRARIVVPGRLTTTVLTDG